MTRKLKTSTSSALSEIKREVDERRLAIVEDVKKANSRELSELPEAFSRKEKVDYITKVQPHLTSIFTLVSKGYTRAKIAETLGISVVEFRKMCKLVPELVTVMEIAVEEREDSVEESLYQLALGFEVEEEVINGFDGTKEKLTKYNPPLLGAVKYVLSNKRGEQYADKKQIIRKMELGSDVKDALMAFKPEDLKRILQISDNREDAFDVEFSESEDSYDEEA